MTTQINGQHYHHLIDYGIRNLSLYREQVNALNVFPVPDGDTGSNMVMTLQNGFAAIEGRAEELPDMARRFADAVVFGARGNSGVIISQFFKGFSESFFDRNEADCHVVAAALEIGVRSAYRAVSNPVEGTVLTVLREATDFVRDRVDGGQIHTIDDTVDAFVERAKTSLEHTPELLPILKSAGVVDSGGAGIIYVFEGMQKYLRGEPLEEARSGRAEPAVDYTRFDRTSDFSLGYCTECLLQLTDGKESFAYGDFCAALRELGESVVTAFEKDKVKVHIHTDTPEQILSFCHRFGEFLSMKIENMSVQHHETEQRIEVVRGETRCDRFSIVAVSHDPAMKRRFMEMGADVVIQADRHCPPSASDFLEAFEKAESETILVFPNSKNTELAAEQARTLYKNAEVTVFSTKSDTECYAALPMVDFETEDVAQMAEDIRATIEHVYTVSLTKATKSSRFDDREIRVGDCLAMVGNRLMAAGKSLTGVCLEVVDRVMAEDPREILTLFVNPSVSETQIETISVHVSQRYPYTELSVVETEDDFWRIVISFE
ncbi:MAG: DAK2 domain-containing protein [Clostridia bacterium]|nr:DAK2 domain-containing protein [Clostridia bacterium]